MIFKLIKTIKQYTTILSIFMLKKYHLNKKGHNFSDKIMLIIKYFIKNKCIFLDG